MRSGNERADHVRVTDPDAWRALAHPARLDLLVELQRLGRARAVDLAAATGMAANRASFHLRQLERYGYVRESDNAQADRREHWWEPASRVGIELAQIEGEVGPEALDAASVAANSLRERARDFLDQWFAYAMEADQDRSGAKQSSIDMSLTLSESEYDSMIMEIISILEKWRDGAGGGEDSRRVRLVSFSWARPFESRGE